MPIATFWTAIAAAATIAAAGVTGVVSKQPILGWFLVLISVGLAASLGMWRHIETRSIARFTMWLRREANYGTTNIQHAAVQTAEDVSRLAAAFAAWETTVERVVNFYCSDADASRIEYLDNWSSRSLSGLNADHCHVLENVAEMVARMRLLLPRLESRETTLRRIVPEGVLDMRVDQLAPTNPDLGQAQRDTQRLGIEIIGLIAIVVTMLLTASSVVYLRGSVVATENSYKVGNR